MTRRDERFRAALTIRDHAIQRTRQHRVAAAIEWAAHHPDWGPDEAEPEVHDRFGRQNRYASAAKRFRQPYSPDRSGIEKRRRMARS